MLETLTSGGVLMWPIGLCSVAALGIIIERAYSLSHSQVLPNGVALAAQNALAGDAQAELGSSELARVLAQVLEATAQGEAAMRECMGEALDAATLRLERSLNWLASIAAVAPLLGLLGTVLGMIDVFAQLMQSQGADLTPLAGGISEALITTAAGLSVAIPSLLCVGHFDRRVLRLSVDIESAARALVRQRQAASA